MIERNPRWRICFGLFGLVAVAILSGSPVGAARLLDDPPTIAPFKTAHVRIEGTVSAQGQELPLQGDGDIDAARGASHLTIGLLGAAFESIVVDGRTYTRNQASGRWEYTEGAQTGGFNPAQLAPYDPATIRAAGRNFTRVGAEPIEGTPTTHWRADADLARLVGLPPGAGGGAGLAGATATMDLWIGDADSHLRRLTLDSQGTASGAGTATPGPFRLALTLTFSNFDQPVPIIAPPGAVPAATPGATPVGGGPLGLPIGRATATSVVPASTAPASGTRPASGGISAPSSVLLSRLLAIGSLLILGLVGLVAVWHRRSRQAAPPEDSLGEDGGV